MRALEAGCPVRLYGGQTPEAGLCFKSKLLTQMHIRHVDCENTWGQPSLTPVWILAESFCINFRMCVRECIPGEAEPRRSEWLQRVLPPGFTSALPGWDGLPSPRLPPSCVCVGGGGTPEEMQIPDGATLKIWFPSLFSKAREWSSSGLHSHLPTPTPTLQPGCLFGFAHTHACRAHPSTPRPL